MPPKSPMPNKNPLAPPQETFRRNPQATYER